MTIAFDAPAAVHRRSLLLFSGVTAALAGAVIHLAPLAALWRSSWAYGIVFLLLGLAQLATAIGAVARPVRPRLQLASGVAAATAVLWLLTRWHVLAGPDPWTPASSVLGFTGHLDFALQVIAVAVFTGLALYGPRPRPRRARRLFTVAATVPLAVMVAVISGLAVVGATDGFSGAGFPGGTVPPQNLPPAARSTVEYCRPDGNRLAMDIYTPPVTAARPAPVAIYVHGGGLVLGDRSLTGLGAALANHPGALFTPLQRQLTERGFVVADVDYRLLPDAAWPAPLTDVKCAIRFLRAHATGLGIDPHRIGVWGSSAGGHLATLLGLTTPADGFDIGQYTDQPSAVQAVVDMFGPTDFTHFADASPFGRFIVAAGLGTGTTTRRSASPVSYIRPGAPPILILHGQIDTNIPIHQSQDLALRLSQTGDPVTFLAVHGTGHTLATSGQRPSPEEITAMVISFFSENLR